MKNKNRFIFTFVVLAIWIVSCSKNEPIPSDNKNISTTTGINASTITGNNVSTTTGNSTSTLAGNNTTIIGTSSTVGTNTTITTGNLSFHLHNNIDNFEIDDVNTLYETNEGRKIIFTDAKFYISNIELIKADGSSLPLDGVIALKSIESLVVPVSKVPVGDYKSIRFYIGLDSLTNLTIPSSGSMLDNSQMWFGSTAQPQGFVYLNISGKIDTTSDMSGSEDDMASFNYKIGTSSNLRKVVMPNKNYTIVANQTNYIHMVCNFYNLFSGIQLNKETNLKVNTPVENATNIGKKIADNIPGMFAYEE